MKTLLIATLALALTSCAQFSALKGAVADQGAAVSNEARDAAEFTLCRAITVGAWLRAYGTDIEKAKAWQTLCGTTVATTPAAK